MEIPTKKQMAQAAELYKRQQTDTKKQSDADKIATHLWGEMLKFYGRQWETSYGHVDGKAYIAWRDALMTLKPEQIRRGLDAVIDEGNEYPPNLIKFLRLCRTPPYTTMSPSRAALPPPNVHRDPKTISAKEKHLAAVKELLT